MQSDDDDLEYDPSAVAVVAKVSTSWPAVSSRRSTANGVASPVVVAPTQTAAAASQPLKDVVGASDGVVHRLRMPQRAAVTAVVVTSSLEGHWMMHVGNREGSLYTFDLTGSESAAGNLPPHDSSHNKRMSTASRNDEQSSTHRKEKREGGPPHPFAPLRSMTPFLTPSGSCHAITRLTPSRDHSHLFASFDGDSALAIDVSSGRQLARSVQGSRSALDTVRGLGHKAPITCMEASPNEPKRFCTVSLDGTIRAWDVSQMSRTSLYCAKHGDGSLTTTVPLHSCSWMSANGDNGGLGLLATGSLESPLVQLWDMSSVFRPGRCAVSLCVGTEHHGTMSLLSIIGQRSILCRSGDGTLKLFDVRNPTSPVFTSEVGAFPLRRAATQSEVSAAHAMTLVASSGSGNDALSALMIVRGGTVAEVSLSPKHLGRTLKRDAPSRIGDGGESEVSSNLCCLPAPFQHDQYVVGYTDGFVHVRRRHDSRATGGRVPASPLECWIDMQRQLTASGRPNLDQSSLSGTSSNTRKRLRDEREDDGAEGDLLLF